MQEYEKNPIKRVLIVGHNPNISKLLHLFLPKHNILMNTSEIAWINIDKGTSELRKYYYKEKLI
ncbi:MAG: hypothetical protein GF353_28890 [Candidatus Lokiarchaeota archaeon]|nr:hypothetical protein [Candidatus Lokiarchaeota archaeon]